MSVSETEVFADQLQARGDPRGELLSLELAAERTPSCAEARRLNREAQFHQLEQRVLPDLHERELLEALCRLPLRTLKIGSLDATLAPVLGHLHSLE